MASVSDRCRAMSMSACRVSDGRLQSAKSQSFCDSRLIVSQQRRGQFIEDRHVGQTKSQFAIGLEDGNVFRRCMRI